MDNELLHEYIGDVAEGAPTADGFDEAVVGVVLAGPNREPVVLYDAGKCVRILMDRDGMSRMDAWEFFEFNVLGAYMGPRAPVFVDWLPWKEQFFD